MSSAPRVVVSRSCCEQPAPFEICEHKGIGHPDSLCDGVAEAVSRALCRAYLSAYGAVQHYNVDKALLAGGQSAPRFGGGRLIMRPRMIICGRATELHGIDLSDFVSAAARDYLATALRCAPDVFAIESAVRPGSPNLQRVIGGATAVPRANDTSFGAGFAPDTALERSVLRTADVLRSAAFRSQFPAAGDDFKIMGHRARDARRLTLALALRDCEVRSVADYFSAKAAIAEYLHAAVDFDGLIAINALDDPAATDVDGIYLTVTGLSAEHGDDGQVGRGNRVNGLITPGRPMSLEAAAGKNAVAHVGKLYNVLAHRVAHAIAAGRPDVAHVSVQILSTIGSPVDEPELIAIELLETGEPAVDDEALYATVRSHLGAMGQLSEELIAGGVAVF